MTIVSSTTSTAQYQTDLAVPAATAATIDPITDAALNFLQATSPSEVSIKGRSATVTARAVPKALQVILNGQRDVMKDLEIGLALNKRLSKENDRNLKILTGLVEHVESVDVSKFSPEKLARWKKGNASLYQALENAKKGHSAHERLIKRMMKRVQNHINIINKLFQGSQSQSADEDKKSRKPSALEELKAQELKLEDLKRQQRDQALKLQAIHGRPGI